MKTVDGYIVTEGRPVRGHAIFGEGFTEFNEGPFRGTADSRGIIVPKLVNCHTHCADAGVKAEPGMTLEELVAPPDGLKHRYLKSASRETLVKDIGGFERGSVSNGISHFIDFREGGAEGCRIAREASSTGIILGRPVSQEYDFHEIEEILSIADGIALSSISDIDYGYAEKVADQTRKAGKAFAIHSSERIREDIDLVLSLQPTFLVHMVEATVPDLRRCADSDVPIAVCPRSNRFFGKVPPLGLMKDTGCTVGIGTDNAMLCSPDLRPEAELFSEILGKDRDSLDWTWRCLTDGGRTLLKYTRRLIAHDNAEEGYAVLPFEGGEPENAWKSADPVTSA